MFSLSPPLSSLVQLYIVVLFVRAIFSWFPIRADSPILPLVRFVHTVTEPVLAPFRRIIPPVGMFDISYLVVFLVFEFVLYPVVRSTGL
jgi:YggT family protein